MPNHLNYLFEQVITKLYNIIPVFISFNLKYTSCVGCQNKLIFSRGGAMGEGLAMCMADTCQIKQISSWQSTIKVADRPW